MIRIENWGRLPYREAWDRQRKGVKRIQELSRKEEWKQAERIAFVEHFPVYTLGFHGNSANMLASSRKLLESGAELIRIERGGDITYHGPGQLVVYPQINLSRRGIGVKEYVEILEEAVIELLEGYSIYSESDKKDIGIWIDKGKKEVRKICAIGIKVSHGATMHGLALNVSTDLSAFSIINPCGFRDRGVTSMIEEGAKIDSLTYIGEKLSGLITERIEDVTRNKH